MRRKEHDSELFHRAECSNLAELNYGIDLFYKLHKNCSGFEQQADLPRGQRSLVKRKGSLCCVFMCSDPRVPEAILAKYSTF